MHSPIFYAVRKDNDQPLPELDEFAAIIPDDDDILEHITKSDWCNANVNDDDTWHRGIATPEDVLEIATLDGLAHTEFTDDTKEWVRMSISKQDGLKRLKDIVDIKQKYLKVVQKGLDHDIIVDGIVSPKQNPGVFTDEDYDISIEHYWTTTPVGGLRVFAYSPSEWMDNALVLSDVLAEHSILEQIGSYLDHDKAFELYIPTGITGDYHF